MSELFFLSGKSPMTKTFTLDAGGSIHKSSYPDTYYFTSHTENVVTLKDFYAALTKHAALGHCMLKGPIKAPLKSESRAGATATEDHTFFLCCDLDDAPFKSAAEFVASEPALQDVSYVLQRSSSDGLHSADSNTLSAHLFFLLDTPMQAPYLKAWLMSRNLDGKPGFLREALTLNAERGSLHWPLDITCSQNDKLVWIAPPIIGKGVQYNLKPGELIQYIPGRLPAIPVARLAAPPIEVLRSQQSQLLNAMREAIGYKKLAATRYVGEFEIQPKPGEAIITGRRSTAEFEYFNINGGDSWAYFHPVGNFEFIHSFKTPGISFLTKELFPGYYKDCKARTIKLNTSPTEQGEVLLAFRDIRTASYWNGTWNKKECTLALHPAKSELQLDHFMQSKGRTLGEFVPIWRMEFDPTSDATVDVDEKFINTFIKSPMLRTQHPVRRDLDACPTIKKVILSAVSNNLWDETTEHFLNWLAVIYQHRIKTGTAWILHGSQGTGKGVLIHNILAPTLGEQYVQARRMSELEEKYSGWLETSLIAFIDEVQVSSSARKDLITGDLKNFITDKKISIRHMNRASYSADNFTNFILASNMNDIVQLPSDDRRYNTGHHQHKRLDLGLARIKAIIDELPAFMGYIMHRKADVDTAATVLCSDSRTKVMNASKTAGDMVASALLEGDMEFLYDSLPDMKLLAELNGANSAYGVAFNEIVKREARLLLASKPSARSQTCHVDSKLTRDELLVIFEYCIGNMPTSPNKFTRLLKHRGIEMKRLRIDNVLHQGIDVKWVVPSTWLNEHRTELAETGKLLRRVK